MVSLKKKICRLLKSGAFQFSAAITLIITLTTLTVSYLILKEEKKILLQTFLSEHRLRARLLAVQQVEPLLYEDFYTIYYEFKSVVDNCPHIQWIVLENEKGEIVLFYPTSPEIRQQIRHPGEEILQISEPIRAPNGKILGRIRVGLRKDSFVSYLRKTEERLLFLVGIILLTGVLAALWMARRVGRPILILNQATQEIGKGHFGKTVQVKAVGEVAELVESFKRMSLQLKELVEEIRRTHERMARSEKLYALGQFAAGVAHEIKNPLTSIALQVSLAKEGRATPKSFEILEKEIQRIDKIIKSFLSFARTRREDFVFTETDVNQVLQEILVLVEPQAKKHNIQIQKQLGNLPRIQSSPEALKQIFLNVIINALQAMEGQGGGTLTIRTSYQDKHLKIEIEDTGPGIPEEIKSKIFDPFFTTKPDGTGMGLAITHNLLQNLGGEIEIYSQEGKGTRVEILLPLRPEESL